MQRVQVPPVFFTYSSVYEKEVRVESVRVLSRYVGNGVSSGVHRHASFGTARNDCTPEALLNTTANFVWWHENPEAPYSPIPPENPNERYTCSLAFPEMDSQAHAWNCHFTLQPDNTWVGQYDGTKSKPIGAQSENCNLSTIKPDQRWINFQFKNLSNSTVHFSYMSAKLIVEDNETQMFFPDVPADGDFHSFACHCDADSIYRPGANSKIEFRCGYPAGPLQSFDLPTFSNESRNWYCYFILGKDEKWTAVFEGTYERKTDLDQ